MEEKKDEAKYFSRLSPFSTMLMLTCILSLMWKNKKFGFVPKHRSFSKRRSPKDSCGGAGG
jgi:hypothetical protein